MGEDANIDLRELRPTQAIQLLNSSPLGEVISESTMRRHRNRAGFRVGRGKTVDLFRYLAWVAERRHSKALSSDAYERHKDRARERNAEMSVKGRDIGPIPEVEDPDRKGSCREDLARFLTTYLPASFPLPFSEDHHRVLMKIQHAALKGGRFVEAVYRGFGKTTIAEGSAIWTVLYGHRRFVPIIGADQSAATKNIDSIQAELEENDLLLSDFPEVCYPIRKLEGITQRCRGQHCNGQPTHIEWQAETIVFPSVKGAAASGSIITARGITGRIRGMKHKRRDGVQLRPDFVIVEDPQTDESAASPSQVKKRLDILKKSILKLSGHQKKISVVVPCTVIQPDDLADQLLDPTLNPSWQGERIPMVRKWADRHEDLWLEEYAGIRNGYDPETPGDQYRAQKKATAYYEAHREEMDAGCEVSWVHCFDESEVSAIQHAYNALIDDGPEVFASEFQNEPLPPEEEQGQLMPSDILAKRNGLGRGAIPTRCNHVTMFIDVQGKLLYFAVLAWEDNFTGYVIDYGAFPDQKRGYFTLRQAKRTLLRYAPGAGQEGAWMKGIKALTEDYLGRDWIRDDGAVLKIGRCLVDANDGNARDVVFQACRTSGHSAVLAPSYGVGIRASGKPFHDRRPQPGEKTGHHWRIPAAKGKKEARPVLSDVNYWKSFIRERWRIALGDPGCLSVWGTKHTDHQMFAEQVAAEYSVRTEGQGRVVEEWMTYPDRRDNHFLDCVVGSAVAASMCGVCLPEHQAPRARKRSRVKFSEKQRGRKSRGKRKG